MLDGVPPAPRGMPQVEVTFDVDANGILNVKAKEKTTNKEQSIRIEASSGLSKDDIERMKKDAEAHGEEDKKKKEDIEIRNTAEQLIYTAEKSLKDAGDKVSAELKTTGEGKGAELKKVKDGEDIEAIKTATAALSTELQKIGEILYKANQQQNPQGGQPGPGGQGGDGNVRDADFKEGDQNPKS